MYNMLKASSYLFSEERNGLTNEPHRLNAQFSAVTQRVSKLI